MDIWLVVGSTGEYDDYRQWNVCAFRDEEMAKARAQECQNKFDEIWLFYESTRNRIDKYQMVNKYIEDNGPFSVDKNMTCDYTGTTYFVDGPYQLEDAKDL